MESQTLNVSLELTLLSKSQLVAPVELAEGGGATSGPNHCEASEGGCIKT